MFNEMNRVLAHPLLNTGFVFTPETRFFGYVGYVQRIPPDEKAVADEYDIHLRRSLSTSVERTVRKVF